MSTQQTQPSAQQQAKMYGSIGRQMASSYPGWTIGISFVLGLFIGWMLLGWVIWPVQWYDAKPSALSLQYQQAYLNNSANSYAVGMPINEVSNQLGEGWTMNQVVGILNGMIQSNYAGNAANLTKFSDALQAYGQVGPTSAPKNAPGISPLLALLLALLAIVGIVILAFLIVRRLRTETPPAQVPAAAAAATAGTAAAVAVPAVSRAEGGMRPVEKTAWAGESQPPMSQFVTTYAVGDDHYDSSFPIETASGDFLGECGVSISKTIGQGTPDKVTALEVWLFDKNDVRTLTKVLMSEYAYNDSALRSELTTKGEPILAKKGAVIELKTQTLKVNVRVDDLSYGGGTPSNSYFQKVTLDLATWSLAERPTA